MHESDQLSHIRLESCNGVPDGGMFVGRWRCGRHEVLLARGGDQPAPTSGVRPEPG